MKEFLKIFLIVLILDSILTILFLKNTSFWKNEKWEDKSHRIISKVYHHDLKPNVEVYETWGGKLKRKIITNSIGFRDSSKKEILENTEKTRILLIGDSFIEGSGYDYEHTFAGLLENELGNNYEILNSAVESYSPSIYFKKTDFFLSQGYVFDKALVFLDLSDIYDELFIKFDDNQNIISEIPKEKQTLERKIKNKIYSLGWFLRDHTLTFRIMYLISDKTEEIKNYLKLKHKASKSLNRSFFNTSRDDAIFYRMTHIDRGFWTFNEDKYLEVSQGLAQSEKYLKKLFELLNQNKIDSYLIIYPWPAQIQYGDKKHSPFWEKFSKSNNINLINLYDIFKSENNRQFIFDNFIYGDIHWNKKGTLRVFNEIIKKIDF
ncbi:hypothetical protein [Candidatus Pelagibacter sp. HIMB1782]|uniref:hypothetical protein n=1 Tax=Candidatus Pelagibacter sp. HIMB1782 TaxID=3413375 RepID=UPI003F82B35C